MRDSCAGVKSDFSNKLNYQNFSNSSRKSSQLFGPEHNHNKVGGKSSGLGNTVYIKSQKQESDDCCFQRKARKNLNYVQNLLNKKIIKHQIGICLKQQFDSSASTYLYEGGGISNIMRCRLSKCPSCAKGIYLNKQKDIEKVLRYTDAKLDADVYMFTLTVSHSIKDKLPDLISILSEAKSKLFKHKCIVNNRPFWSHFSLEINYSFKNGWHPHYHVLLAVKKGSLDNIENIDFIKSQWVKICNKLGVNCDFEKGLDIKIVDDAERASKYAVKDEVFKKISVEAASDNKSAKKAYSFSIQKLIDIATNNDWSEIPVSIKEAAIIRLEKLIVEYYQVKRRRTFQSCKAFKGLLEEANKKLEMLLGDVEKPEKKEKIKRIAISSNAFHKFVKAEVWHKVLLLHKKDADIQDVLGELWNLVQENNIKINIDCEIAYQEMTAEEFVEQKQKLTFTSLNMLSILNISSRCAA
jgi:hypothetical protein